MSDQSADIEIPIVEICNGWTVDDIKTVDDCDDAFAYLTGAVAAIEAKLDDLLILGRDQSTDYIRTKSALRWKKAALSIIQQKRGKFNRAERQRDQNKISQLMLDYFKQFHPDEMAAARDFAVGTLSAEPRYGRRMTGLPRATDTTREQDAWNLFVCGGVEKLTYALQRGDRFTDKALHDMTQLSRRLGAFDHALKARIEAAGDVLEDTE